MQPLYSPSICGHPNRGTVFHKACLDLLTEPLPQVVLLLRRSVPKIGCHVAIVVGDRLAGWVKWRTWSQQHGVSPEAGEGNHLVLAAWYHRPQDVL
eukprot:365707-Chlamydomonas_euryale.AAC.8